MNVPKDVQPKSSKKSKKLKNENRISNQNQQEGKLSINSELSPSESKMENDKNAALPKQLNAKKLKEKSLQEQFNIRTNNAAEFIEKLPDELININLDKAVNEIKEIDSKCDFDKCKVKTTLIGEDCEYCNKRFCFKHNLPEVHGCADAIKRAERKTFLKPVTGKQKNEDKELAQAKKRLEAKLKDMKVGRMQKQGNKK